jgi:pyrimidine-specific ribonucleoside hydrolase
MKSIGLATLATVIVGLAISPCIGADEHANDQSTKGERTYHMIKDIPLDPAAYQPAAAKLVRDGIPERYGHEEWAAVVLTNEVHQHVGIYSIVGAKMGVRARELLQAPPRTVDVTVESGPRPPVSCIIDGLQVALGSTLAQDLIHAPATDSPQTAAVFAYKGRKIRLSLKADAQKKISDAIAKAIKDCGNLTPAYFDKIEELSYQIWAEFDRQAIFSETKLQPESPGP